MEKVLSYIKAHLVMVIVVALVIVTALTYYGVKQSVLSKGNQQEKQLNSVYPDAQNVLSDCITKIRETAGVAKGQTAATDQILTDAVKGRYDGNGSSASVGKGQLFSAIKEAYPDLSQLGGTFDKVINVVVGCRSDYRDKQSYLLDRLNAFESWRTGSWKVRHFGKEFPNNELVARVGSSTPLRGQAALDKMYQIVLVESALDAYKNGTYTPEDPFGPTPSPSQK